VENYAKAGMFSTASTEYMALANEKLTCKTIYNTILNHQHLPPPTAEKRLVEQGFIFYSLPFRVTNEVNLSVFQYKIVHNILYTNKILHKMKQQPDCHCHDIDQMQLHLFVECALAKSFWNGTTPNVEKTLLWNKTRSYMVF